MKHRIPLKLALLLVAFGSPFSLAQIAIGLRSDRTKYLRYEPVNLEVILRNYTGNTLVFGLNPKEGFLRFRIKRPDQRPVLPLGVERNPASGLILGAGETKTLTITINTLFDMKRPGIYEIRVVVGHPRLANDYLSDAVTLEIREGTTLISRRIGIPTSNSTASIQYRDVHFLLFHGDKGDIYCLRVEDAKNVYGVVRLGPHIAGVEPQMDVDAVSNIHVLFMTRPRLFVYRVYDYDLNLKEDRYFALDSTLPRLVRDPELGQVRVRGGRPAVEGVDYRLHRPEVEGLTPVTPPGATSPTVMPENTPLSENKKKPRSKGGIAAFFRRIFGGEDKKD